MILRVARPGGAQRDTGTTLSIDATHVFCGSDGWCQLTAIIDCGDRTIVGWRLSKTGSRRSQRRRLRTRCARKIDPAKNELTLRSDNGLVFGAKPFVKVVRRYEPEQEYITPDTPEQNGMIERFLGTLKSECVWQHRFQDRDQAFVEIARWLDRYHTERPHSALGYLTPAEFREKLAAELYENRRGTTRRTVLLRQDTRSGLRGQPIKANWHSLPRGVPGITFQKNL